VGVVPVQIFHLTARSFAVRKRCPIGFLFALFFVALPPAFALTLDDLDPAKEWRLTELSFSGNTNFTEAELRSALTAKIRPWYTPWRKHMLLDPIAFATDLERLTRFYQSHGYYEVSVSYELTPQTEQAGQTGQADQAETDQEGLSQQETPAQDEIQTALVTALITVSEGEPVRVAQVDIVLGQHKEENGSNSELVQPNMATQAAFETALPELQASLPLKTGDIFVEDSYQSAEAQLKAFFLERGYGWTEVERQAEVILDQRAAQLKYSVAPGPLAVFGETDIEGLQRVAPELVTREITYQPGEQFSLDQLKASRSKIVDLGLFHSVQITPAPVDGHPADVPMRIRVEEREPRDIKVGLGFGTEDQFRGQFEWHNRNWFGGGRRLSALLTFSSITRSLGVQFVQPYFPTKRSRLIIDLTQGQEDEDTYLLNFSRLRPRLEHHFSLRLSGFLGYRFEFVKLNDLSSTTIREIGGLKRDGFVSGPTLGLTWDTTEDPFNPQHGTILSLTADQIGKFWGGDYEFYTVTTEAKQYHAIGWQTVLAGRVKLSLADAFGKKTNLPIFERLYAGGEKGVRGYGRRRLGPISSSDDPLGGLSRIEGSVELRRPVWKGVSGTLFFDFGQVSTQAHDIPIDDLQFSAGFGVGYETPLGPLQLYLGFPFNPPSGDSPVQVHFSVGQFF
jgi:outer membrane protein insertion porin family